MELKCRTWLDNVPQGDTIISNSTNSPTAH